MFNENEVLMTFGRFFVTFTVWRFSQPCLHMVVVVFVSSLLGLLFSHAWFVGLAQQGQPILSRVSAECQSTCRSCIVLYVDRVLVNISASVSSDISIVFCCSKQIIIKMIKFKIIVTLFWTLINNRDVGWYISRDIDLHSVDISAYTRPTYWLTLGRHSTCRPRCRPIVSADTRSRGSYNRHDPVWLGWNPGWSSRSIHIFYLGWGSSLLWIYYW